MPRALVVVSVLTLAIAGVAIAAIALGDSHEPIASLRPARTTPAGTGVPAVCGRLRPTRTGRITSGEATELSGLVVSRTRPGLLWTHNDSGDRARILAVRAGGAFAGSFDIPGAESIDAEDIATGPRPGGGALLYLADIGDNDAERASVVVWRVPEPSAAAAPGGTTAPPRRIELRYPDGAQNAETLLVDPRRGDLAIVTKDFGGRSVLYTAPASAGADGTVTTLRRAARIDFGFAGLATGGDVSRSGSVIVVRTYGAAFAWTRRAGESIGAAMRRRPCRSHADLATEGQGEAIALTADGRGFYTVAEGRNPPIRLYSPARR